MSGATLLSLVLLVAAGDEPAAPDPPGRAPLVGRPADVPFTEASASFARGEAGEYRAPFTLTATASPARLRAGAALRYELTIRADGQVHHPPERFDLRLVPAFDRDFHIEDITEGKSGQLSATTWRWAYRLKPRHAGVRAVPGLPFAYYNPELTPAERGFQLLWTEPVAIEVSEPEAAWVPPPVGGLVIQLAEGPAVLRPRRAWPGPGPGLIALAWAVPAALAAAWYALWRWRYPDALALARRRRSRAARRALRALRGLDGDIRREGQLVARAVAAYLRERFDLRGFEPTPEEGRALLLARQVPGELAESAADLLGGCAAARFAPEAPEGDLAGWARALIVEVEEQCPPSS